VCATWRGLLSFGAAVFGGGEEGGKYQRATVCGWCSLTHRAVMCGCLCGEQQDVPLQYSYSNWLSKLSNPQGSQRLIRRHKESSWQCRETSLSSWRAVTGRDEGVYFVLRTALTGAVVLDPAECSRTLPLTAVLCCAVLCCAVLCCAQLPNTRFDGAAFPRICVWAR